MHLFLKSFEGLDQPDLQGVFTPGSYKEGAVYVLDDYPGMTAGAWQHRPESTNAAAKMPCPSRQEAWGPEPAAVHAPENQKASAAKSNPWTSSTGNPRPRSATASLMELTV